MGRYSAVNQYRLPFLLSSGRKEGVEDGVPVVAAEPPQIESSGNAQADASASNIYMATKTAIDTANANILNATKAAADKAALDVLAAAQVASTQASSDVLNATKVAVEQAAKAQAAGDLSDSNTIRNLYYLIILLVVVLMGGGWYTYSLRNACMAAGNPAVNSAAPNSA